MSSITAIDLAAVPYHPLTLLQIGNIWMEVFADKSDKFQKHNARTNPSLRLAQELPLRILLAEDQLIDRTVALRILQSLGYQADVAVNGQEALKALHHKHYDLLLTDVQMPQMGGLELMQRICQEWSLDERPCIIAVTSEAMPEVREQCVNAGMTEFLRKPLAVHELVAALRKCRFRSSCNQSEDRV